jgi:hypothetical protein
MKIHEYQAKEIFKKYGLPVPRGIVAHNAKEAEEAAKELGTPVVVVKAQVHAGGRGKAGAGAFGPLRPGHVHGTKGVKPIRLSRRGSYHRDQQRYLCF